MSNRQVPQSNPLVPVHTRLFEEDVDILKREAGARGIPWQVHLRLLVREAVKRKVVVR